MLIDARSKRTGVTGDAVVNQLAKVAFANLKDFVEFGPDGVRIKPGEEVDGTLLQEVSETVTLKGGTQKVKLKDSMKALELLGKHLGLWSDQVVQVKISQEIQMHLEQIIEVVQQNVEDPATKDRIQKDLEELGIEFSNN